MDYREVFAAVESKAGRLAKMLKDIIDIDTTVPPGLNYPEMVDYMEPLLAAAGLETERVVVPESRWRKLPLPLEGERVNLVGTLESGKPPASIYAHMDVVPAEGDWNTDPFQGTMIDGEIFGRGAVDMKGSIPPVIVALEVIKELGLESRFDVNVLFCTDEEIGIDPGATYLAEKGYFKPPIVHLEGGGQGPYMVCAFAGSLGARITTFGKEVHSGVSFLGINAVEEMVPVMEELLELKRVVEKRVSGFPSIPRDEKSPNKMTPTFNLNMIRGGEKLNIVPDRCVLEIDRRFIVEESLEEVTAEIEEAVERGRKASGAERVDCEFTTIYLPHVADTTSEDVQRWMEGTRLALGLPADTQTLFFGLSGSTDMSFVGDILGTDRFVGSGVFDPAHLGAHQANESVPIENLVHLCQELIYFLVDLES